MAKVGDTESLTWRVTPDLLAVVDEGGIFLDVNPAWMQTLGRRPDELKSRPFLEFLHPDDVAATEDAYLKLQHGVPILKFENRYRHKDGSYRWLDWNAVPEGDLILCSARDITEAKKTALDLAYSSQEAQFRDQFIAVLGHDMRNPMAAIATSLRIALEEEQTERARKFLEMARESAARMSELIDNVTDFARARLGGNIGVEPQDGIALEPVVKSVVQEHRLTAPDALIAELYDCPTPVRCDPDRVRQIVSNLVANAVHHGESGHPIGVRASEENGRFVLSVVNSGPPIPKRTQEVLFQPFVRAEFRSSQNGLGLGLYIAKQIAEAHDGTLTFTSSEEETEFRFEMPL
ncbi:PAS domain S-box-containing protein [Litoreibacter ponti]|uniref:histidine kinase n=1 Tax=Litoreibacter ponti TaxID=1510457 RepID=A0A2T6BFN7_9RHOB|nr:PAS domain-containing sensor histidine kinase [Litoreibacter ponti]PTX54882.1 PAS domain S-box-containing protein [Litoreibacter ponti]